MFIAPLPVAAPSPPPSPASDGPVIGVSGAGVAGDGSTQGAQAQDAQGSVVPGPGSINSAGKTGSAKGAASGSDPNKSAGDTAGADFAQALAASLGAQPSNAPTSAAPAPSDAEAATAASSVAPSAATGFATLLAPSVPLDLAGAFGAQSVGGPADKGAPTDGIGANGALLPVTPTTPGLGQPQPVPSPARSAQAATQSGPASSPSGGRSSPANTAATPGSTGSAVPNVQTAANGPSTPGVQTDQGAAPTPDEATPVPPQIGDVGGGASPSPLAQPAAAKLAPLSTNLSALSARGGSAKASPGKIDAGAEGPDQSDAASPSLAQTASTDAAVTPGADLKNGGGDDGASTQTAQSDDSAAQTAPTAQPDASALASSLQAQAAPSPQPVAPKADAVTVSQLSAQIVQTVNGGKSSFDMTLHPEGMGDVQVKVSVDRNGAVTASMSFNNPQAAAELGARAADLKDALSQAGFTVADNGLSFNMSGQNQSGAGQGGWSQGADPNAGRAFQAARDNSEDLLAAVSQAAANLQRPSAAGLDIRI